MRTRWRRSSTRPRSADDHVLWRDFPERCEVVFEWLVGPFVVPPAGHFLQWERAELFDAALTAFFRDKRK
jgi:pimeloyl-ACP methyl ester carboxylesterase